MSATEPLLVQTADKNVVKGLKPIDIGTKAKGPFLPSPLDMDESEKSSEVIVFKHIKRRQSI